MTNTMSVAEAMVKAREYDKKHEDIPSVSRTLADEIDQLRAALNAAAYALFQIKRMVPEAIVEHSKQAYDRACAVLDGDAVEPSTPQPEPLRSPQKADDCPDGEHDWGEYFCWRCGRSAVQLGVAQT